MLSLVDKLQPARDTLAAARDAELWTLTFGEEAAAVMPNLRPLAGARKQPLMAAGIHQAVDADRIIATFRADAERLAGAATDQQRVLIDGERTPDLRRDAVWSSTPGG
jgi:hypothetical protein